MTLPDNYKSELEDSIKKIIERLYEPIVELEVLADKNNIDPIIIKIRNATIRVEVNDNSY